MLKISCKQHQKGFTLIEMSVVLVIIGVLIGGIIKGKQLIDDSNATAEVQAMQLFVSNIQGRYGQEGDTQVLSIPNVSIITARIVPPGYSATPPKTITNTMGGAITVVPASVNSPFDGFGVLSAGYNFAACKKMAMAIKKSVVNMNIGGGATLINSETNPINSDIIDFNCNREDGITPGNISLFLTFKKNG